MPYLGMRDGTNLYYEEWPGKGETVLIIHGLCSSHLKLWDFISEFKGEYHVVAMDQRGHGLT